MTLPRKSTISLSGDTSHIIQPLCVSPACGERFYAAATIAHKKTTNIAGNG